MLAGLAAQTLIVGSVAGGIVTFSTAALVMVTLLFATAIAAAVADNSTLRRFKTSGPSVKRWGGRVLLGVGTWFIAIGLFAGPAGRVLFS